MRDALQVLISGYYGYANPGDEAILRVLVSQLREHVPDVTISVISGNPEETAASHQVGTVLWSDPDAIAEAVRKSDLVITGGGGIFHDYGGYTTQGLFSEGNWGVAFHATAGLLAGLYGKPLAIYGVGVGPLFSVEAREITKAVCEAASTITVRDEGSRALLEELGISGAVVTADPGFLFQPGPIMATPNRVVVVVRQWAHGVEQTTWEAELAAGLDLFLERHGGEVVFLPFQQLSGEAEDDVAASRRVLQRMTKPDAARVWEGQVSLEEKAALIAGARLVVGMRLHSIIFALRERVPVLALTYDDKVREVVRRAGLRSLEMEAVDRNLVASRMEEALTSTAPDPGEWIALAARNTELALQAARRGPGKIPLSSLRSGLESLLAEQKKLRKWLVDQRDVFQYEVRVEQEKLAASDQLLEEERKRCESEQSLRVSEQRRRADMAATLGQARTELNETREQVSQTEAARVELEAKLAAMTQDRDRWRVESERLEQEKAVATARAQALEEEAGAWQRLHQTSTRDWEEYSGEMDRRLAEYRGQRPWRAMLALRKAYLLATQQGWRGKARLLPYGVSVLLGGGAVETEQLEFPRAPKTRKL